MHGRAAVSAEGRRALYTFYVDAVVYSLRSQTVVVERGLSRRLAAAAAEPYWRRGCATGYESRYFIERPSITDRERARFLIRRRRAGLTHIRSGGGNERPAFRDVWYCEFQMRV